MVDTQPVPEEEPRPQRVLVPKLLYSAYEEAPFSRCLACGDELSAPDSVYHVQKSWRHGEVVFELALCAACTVKTARSFSRESMEKIHEFFSQHFHPSASLSRCHFCEADFEPDAEYEIAAACAGAHLLRPPVAMCASCSSRSQEDLSAKTRGAWGDFIERNLPGVPSEMEPDRLPITF